MNIRPSAAIRQDYNEISELCKKSGEPIYLTKNGKGDLVVMDIGAFERREKMSQLRENLLVVEEDRIHGENIPSRHVSDLLVVEEDRIHGEKGYSVGEAAEIMRNAIRKAANRGDN